MALPQAITDFLADNAASNGAAPPANGDDLFKTGALDSFSLVDLVGLLEEQCGIKVPDKDVTPANFQTIAAIESYVAAHST
ncbi:MAG TPA: acyl carrier protein [Pyrinomonadaceae bacterium]|jgi:acyl carrier protein